MRQILLNDIRLFGYHGVHKLEQVIGNEFQLSVKIEVEDKIVNELSDSVDYEEVYTTLKKEFSKTEQLLETLSDRIISALFNQFRQISSVAITIEKLNAPIVNFSGKVGVYTKKNRS